MSSNNFDEVILAFEKSKLTPKTLSFEGKSLKLNSKEDAKVIVDGILNTSDLECLNLEGNTLGVDAAQAIAKALEKQPNFKRALWKDMFTGRMKTEIPIALQHLGDGLVKAGARLVELDLSDNAFGPIGVEGLAALLRSSSCYALEELRLNNNGLGITGGKLLAKALMDCYNCSNLQGKALSLKVFIAGRNRLENEGAKALAEVFKTIGTLEEIVMPQNGIYHDGIKALSKSFTQNKNLQILNLNDNTIGGKGAASIAKVLPYLQKLKSINFGDCLLKTKGALALADGLKTNHTALEELILNSNEISIKGGLAIVNSLKNKEKLKTLSLDGNYFNHDDKTKLTDEVKKIGRFNSLGSLDECESDEDEEEEEQDDEEDDDDNESNEQEDDNQTVTYENFLNAPTAESFLKIWSGGEHQILHELKKSFNLNDALFLIMQVGAFTTHQQEKIAQSAISCTELLYKELYAWAEKNDNIPLVNNSVLVYLDLIKSEDKKFKCTWNTESCISALKVVMKQNCIPQKAVETLKFFLERQTLNKVSK